MIPWIHQPPNQWVIPARVVAAREESRIDPLAAEHPTNQKKQLGEGRGSPAISFGKSPEQALARQPRGGRTRAGRVIQKMTKKPIEATD
ncbi:MAG: hypothetical protein ACREAC_00805 [Blastocatellia bacterium]